MPAITHNLGYSYEIETEEEAAELGKAFNRPNLQPGYAVVIYLSLIPYPSCCGLHLAFSGVGLQVYPDGNIPNKDYYIAFDSLMSLVLFLRAFLRRDIVVADIPDGELISTTKQVLDWVMPGVYKYKELYRFRNPGSGNINTLGIFECSYIHEREYTNHVVSAKAS